MSTKKGGLLISQRTDMYTLTENIIYVLERGKSEGNVYHLPGGNFMKSAYIAAMQLLLEHGGTRIDGSLDILFKKKAAPIIKGLIATQKICYKV